MEDGGDGGEETVRLRAVGLHGESAGSAGIREQGRLRASVTKRTAICAVLVDVAAIGDDREGAERGKQAVKERSRGTWGEEIPLPGRQGGCIGAPRIWVHGRRRRDRERRA